LKITTLENVDFRVVAVPTESGEPMQLLMFELFDTVPAQQLQMQAPNGQVAMIGVPEQKLPPHERIQIPLTTEIAEMLASLLRGETPVQRPQIALPDSKIVIPGR
jgi:hypothetical protein